jgi:hypothetical protein
MVDSNSKNLIDEINSKSKLMTFTPALCVLLSTLNYFFLTKVWVANNILRNSLIGFDIVLCGLIVWWVHNYDLIRKTTILLFELDSDLEKYYQKFHDNYSEFMKTGRVWTLKGLTKDSDNWKTNAGATDLVDRTVVNPNLGNPKYLTTNIMLPHLPAGKQTLYFLPTMILVYEKSGKTQKVGAINYGEVNDEYDSTRFIETDPIPNDANIVDSTWQYVNKGGGPDRRYSNNYEIPIVEYGTLHLKSNSGLNEKFHISNLERLKYFKSAIKYLKEK